MNARFATGGDAADARPAFAERLETQSPEERRHVVVELVAGETLEVLRTFVPHPPVRVAPHHTFRALGLDSVAAVNLVARLEEAVRVRLPATLVFDHPTVERAAAFVEARLMGEPETPPETAAARVVEGDPVAIVGMGCRFPGGVSRPEDLWEVLAGGRDVIAEFPADRGWDVAGLLDEDPDRAGQDVRDAGRLPVRRRRVRRRVLRHLAARGPGDGPAAAAAAGDLLGGGGAAGIDPATLRGRSAGVFAGAGTAGVRPAAVRRAGGPRRAPGHRRRAERDVGPGRVPPRPGGPGGDRGHGVLVVAGGDAPGGRRRCAHGRMLDWRWPAA